MPFYLFVKKNTAKFKNNHRYQIPFLIFTTERGTQYDLLTLDRGGFESKIVVYDRFGPTKEEKEKT